jgi:hypothetical protein
MPSILELIEKERDVFKQAPFTFGILLFLGLGAGWVAAGQYYHDRLDTKDGEIHRYRLALGIDKATGGALIELNNQELAAYAQNVVQKLRGFNQDVANRMTGVEKEVKDKKLPPKEAAQLRADNVNAASRMYDAGLASDALSVERELRKRINPADLATVVGVIPGFVTGDGTRISMLELMRGTGDEVFYVDKMADEIDQMSKLLPHN